MLRQRQHSTRLNSIPKHTAGVNVTSTPVRAVSSIKSPQLSNTHRTSLGASCSSFSRPSARSFHSSRSLSQTVVATRHVQRGTTKAMPTAPAASIALSRIGLSTVEAASVRRRHFATVSTEDSDPAFAAQKKTPAQATQPEEGEEDDLQAQIHEVVTQNKIVLFMKGTPDRPQCGFSSRVVQILSHLNVAYEACNVLDSPELREGIKVYSNWPTIPQLYVDGEFVGGCDIVTQMYQSGELHQHLGMEAPDLEQ